MPASRTDTRSLLSTLVVDTAESRFHLPAQAARVGKNGVEFRSPDPFALWTEMKVTVETPGAGGREEGVGVVVACEGNRHQGYAVSILFLDLAVVREPGRPLTDHTSLS